MMNQVSDLPATIGDYEVLGELARDDASVVLRARQTSLDRIVALKVVRAEWAADPGDLERFLRGARAAARLDHPHIVRVFDVGRADDLHYFAMGLVEGKSLSQRVAARGPLPPREAIELVLRVAQATAYTHGQKIVHRGLSPDCVLLEADGKPRVTGFGLARPTAPGHSLMAGGVRVDPFTAPETITGTALADSPAVDVYGLGGILYFAFTGQPPHKAASIAELAASIAEVPVVSPRKLNSKVPRDFEAICLRCLATSPSDRFASAAQIVEALDQVVSGKGSGTGWLGRRSASPQNSVEGSTDRIVAGAVSKAAVATTDTILLSDVTTPRRSRLRASSLLMGILLLTVGGGIVAWQLRDKANPDAVGLPGDARSANAASNDQIAILAPPPKAIAPHSAEQAAALQAAWAKHLALPEQSENSLGMKFRLIPPGEFDMGATDADANDREAAFAKRETDRKAWAAEFLVSERPQHRVHISKPFYLGVHEVTNQQYAAFAREYTTSNSKTLDEAALQQQPASAITADEATAFCRWLSKLEGRTYRLPTEAEWEFAARAGTTTRYFTGDTEESLRDYANVADQSLDGTTPFEPYYHWVHWNDGFPEFAPVGTFRANPFGLHDLHGSAFEWTGDWYDEKFYARTPSWDPNGPISGTRRVGKGGSAAALTAPEYLASSARIAFLPKHELGDWGFRVVLEVPAEKWPSLTSDERLERGREWAEFLLVEEQKQSVDSVAAAEQIQVAWQQIAGDLRAGESAVAQLDPSARDRVTVLRKMAADRDRTLIRQLAKMERDLIASLTAENWTINDSAATTECDRLFREAGIDVNAPSIADTVAKYEARSEIERQMIKYWLTRWECYATTANRPEAARIRTLLGVLEDDPWGHQFLAARTNAAPAPLLALATAATKTLPPSAESSELLAEALIARGLTTKPETVALIKAVQSKYKTRAWPNIRLAELQQPTVLQVTGLDRVRRIHEITGFLREAQSALGGENSGLSARITAIESMGTPSQLDRSVAEAVLAKGGVVMILQAANSWDWVPIAKLENLPTLPFRVVGVSHSDTSATDADLKLLSQVVCLQQLYLHRTQVTDAGVQWLMESLPTLLILGLDETPITDASLPRLAKLKTATVRGTDITAEGLRLLTSRSQFELLRGSPLSTPDTSSDSGNGTVSFRHAGNIKTPVEHQPGPLTFEAIITLPAELLPISSRVFTFRNNDFELGMSLGNHRKLYSFIRISEGNKFITLPHGEPPLPFDQPCHVAAVFDTLSHRCYVNGRKVGTIASPQITGNPLTFNIATWNGRLGVFTGTLDEVRISNVARYDADFVPTARHEPDDQTLVLYHFDEADGDVVQDSSGRNNHGTLVGETKRVRALQYVPPTSARSLEVTK